jgi:DNA polymerase I-like protein with 3'-5' exonuclease and polymerase domains
VAVDSETSGLYVDDGARISVVSAAWRDVHTNNLKSDAWAFDHGRNAKTGQDDLLALIDADPNRTQFEWNVLMQWLNQQRLIMHNAYFDLQMFHAGHREYGFGIDLTDALVHDTMLTQWVLEPTESAALKSTASRIWGANESASARAIEAQLETNGGRYDFLPWAEVSEYARQDAELTLRLAERQFDLLEGSSEYLSEQVETELKVCKALTRMAYRGIGYDATRSRLEGAKAKAQIAKVSHELPFKLTEAATRAWFINTCRCIPHCMTAGKKASLSECCIRSFQAQGAPWADEYATLQKLKRTVSVYYDGYAKATGVDGRLRTDYKQMGTISMRFSSHRVNLQAIPQDHKLERLEGVVLPRALFRASEGQQLWEFDLGQAEARVGAKIAGCTSWLEMFEEGRDLHSETARQLFDDDSHKWRQIGKRANFALIYGVGAHTFRGDVEKMTGVILSEREAQEIVTEWRKLFPEFPRINHRTEDFARRRGYVELIDGRRRYFRPFEEMHKAFNAVVQGSIAQVIKHIMIDLDECGYDLLLQVHDSIVIELDAGDIVGNGALITRRMGELATKMCGVPMFAEAKHWHTLADESVSV